MKSEILNIGETEVLVQFVTDDNQVYRRNIRCPRMPDGSVDEQKLQRYVEDHKRALGYKRTLGIIQFEKLDSSTANSSNLSVEQKSKPKRGRKPKQPE